MEFRGLFVFFVVGVAICYVQGFPRDSSVVKAEEVIRVDDNSVAATAKDKINELQTTTTLKIEFPENIHVTTDRIEIITPRQVSCKHEEATDDLVCQEHCLPKGYSYGLCVHYKCSCI